VPMTTATATYNPKRDIDAPPPSQVFNILLE